MGIHQQHDAGRDGEPGLRPGRSGPGRRQPDGLRDVLRGEAAVLHRGLPGLRPLRPQRRERVHGVQPHQPVAVLLAPHRPDAAGRRRRRVRRPADVDDDHRRGEGDGQDEPRVDRELHRRRHRAGVRRHLDRRRAGQDRGGAVLQLPGGPRAPGRGPARRVRHAHDGREPEPVGPGPQRPIARQRVRPRRRRPPLPDRQARLRRDRQLLRKPGRRLADVDREAAALVGALLPAAGCDAPHVRPGGRVPVRVEPPERLQQEQRRHQAQRVVLGREPGLRSERRRVHDERRPHGRARGAGVPQAHAGPLQPRPVAVRGEVEHVELRGRCDGRRVLRAVRRTLRNYWSISGVRARRPVGLQRPADARRADDAGAWVHRGVGEYRGRRAEAGRLGAGRELRDPAGRVVVG